MVEYYSRYYAKFCRGGEVKQSRNLVNRRMPEKYNAAGQGQKYNNFDKLIDGTVDQGMARAKMPRMPDIV